MRIHRALGLFAALAALAAGQAAYAGDLSPLSDFGSSAITRESAFLSQYGERNLISVDQHLALPGLTGHYAEISQTGARNEAHTAQDGDANRLRVRQSGSDNYARITQTGYRNAVDLAQDGIGSRFTSVQTGDDNLIVNIQPGGSTATMTQTGNNNVIEINQNTAGLSVEINMVGNGMVVRQN